MALEHLDRKPSIHESVYIDPSARIFGDVTIEAGASIWCNASLRGDVHYIRIGENSNIQDNAVLHVTHDGPYTPGGAPLVIGADVTVGHGAILHACTIGDAVLVGMHATVLDGAVVGRHSMIGAGALVAPGKLVGEGELWIGNPARRMRTLSDAEIERLYYSARHYVKIKDEYLGAGSI